MRRFNALRMPGHAQLPLSVERMGSPSRPSALCAGSLAGKARPAVGHACTQIESKEKAAAVIEGRSVVAWESDLSAHNFKTVSFEAFKACICAKLLVYSKVAPFYEGRLWRKMRLNGYYNRCRSESQMLARMRATFGPPAGVVIGIGDWGQHEQRAFMEPHKGKGFRDVLRRGGYRVLLVDAFRTSVQLLALRDRSRPLPPVPAPRGRSAPRLRTPSVSTV